GSPGTPPCYLPSDIANYINGLPAGFTTQPAVINNINITIGTTTYQNSQSQVTGVTSVSSANGSILELTQDISTSAGIAQGATINVYFTEGSENGFLEFFNRSLDRRCVDAACGRAGAGDGAVGDQQVAGFQAVQGDRRASARLP